MKTKTTARLARLLSVVLVACLFACFMSTTAFASNDSVKNCANGVLQVNLVYTTDDGTAFNVSSGTGFLVNETTLITCHHVVFLSDADLQALAQAQNKSVKDVQNRLSVTVTVSRDLTIPATYLNGSAEVDFAIIKMSQALSTKTPLKLRSTEDLQQTEKVWTIGFPVMDTLLQTYSTYSAEDVNITGGTVTKVATGINMYSGANTDYIQTDCNMDYGNSGGPMVDENGYVVGISQGVWESELSDYYNAIAIDHVTGVLADLGIPFETANASTPTTPSTEATDTTTTATEADTDVVPTLPTLDSAADESESSGMLWVLIAAGAVVAVIVVVVVVVILSGGKKKNEGFVPPQPTVNPVQPPIPPVQPMTPPTGMNTVPMQNAGETSLLSASSAGETTVLSRNAVNGGTLVRKNNGESISINADQFVIGRDRKSVNFCISDNSSISRNHVRINVRGGVAYLSDLGAANGTFVNGVKVMPRQEVALKSGDKITLADEDFEYKN